MHSHVRLEYSKRAASWLLSVCYVALLLVFPGKQHTAHAYFADTQSGAT
jgi:hypothetical protein